MYRLPEDGKI